MNTSNNLQKVIFSMAKNYSFKTPNFIAEWNEAVVYPEFKKIGKNKWVQLAKKGRRINITSVSQIKDVENTDAAMPKNFTKLLPEKQLRAIAQIGSGAIELPLVARYSDGFRILLGGNTRLTGMMFILGYASFWQFEVPDEVANLA